MYVKSVSMIDSPHFSVPLLLDLSLFSYLDTAKASRKQLKVNSTVETPGAFYYFFIANLY